MNFTSLSKLGYESSKQVEFLVVDDDPTNLEVVTHYLKKVEIINYTYNIALDGQQGLISFKKNIEKINN